MRKIKITNSQFTQVQEFKRHFEWLEKQPNTTKNIARMKITLMLIENIKYW